MTAITINSILKTMENAGWDNDFTVTCPDGAVARVTPCGDREIQRPADVKYYIIHWNIDDINGARTIRQLCKYLSEHEVLLEKQNACQQLQKYFNTCQATGWTRKAWKRFSDQHQALYGCRPQKAVCDLYGHVCKKHAHQYPKIHWADT